MTRPHVVIAGLMGVGKTTTARLLSARLGRAFRDSDADIVTLFGCSGAELAAQFGVDELHRVEAAVLLGALASPDPSVIAAAGWAIEDRHCRAALRRRAATVVLRADVDDIIERAASGDHRRPLTRDEYLAQAVRRDPLYDEVDAAWFDAECESAELIDGIVVQLGLDAE